MLTVNFVLALKIYLRRIVLRIHGFVEGAAIFKRITNVRTADPGKLKCRKNARSLFTFHIDHVVLRNRHPCLAVPIKHMECCLTCRIFYLPALGN